MKLKINTSELDNKIMEIYGNGLRKIDAIKFVRDNSNIDGLREAKEYVEKVIDENTKEDKKEEVVENFVETEKKEVRKIKLSLKIKIFFAWYDFWIGWYFNRTNKILYICFIPTICISIFIERRIVVEK